MLIPIKQYAEMHCKATATVRQKCIRGTFATAQKIGRDWLIDDQEPYRDARVAESPPTTRREYNREYQRKRRQKLKEEQRRAEK